MKKIISLILCFGLILPFCTAKGNALSINGKNRTYEKTNNENPVIIVRGMDFTDGLKYDLDTQNEKTVGVEFNVGQLAKTLSSAFGAAVKGFSVKKGVEVIINYAYTLFEGYACDNSGESLNKNVSSKLYFGSVAANPGISGTGGTNEQGLLNACVERYGANKTYYFIYDWRLDPVYNAALLNDMVLCAMNDNLCDKVNIICNSMGGIITLAYLNEYGSEHIDSLVANSSALYGADVATELMCGELEFNADAANRYLSSMLPQNKSLINVLYKTGILSLGCRLLQSFAEKYKTEIYDGVLTPVFGTMPSVWSLVSPDRYSEAKEFIFGNNKEAYSELLKKTDSFQSETVSNRKQILDAAVAGGMKLSIVTGYNMPNVCVYPSAAKQGDGILETHAMSLGATVSAVGSVLTENELLIGDSKYVSADKCINASTCAYPDYTWFIKNAPHIGCIFGSDYTELILCLTEADTQPTVTAYSEYPQFISADAEQNLSPLE